MRLSPFDKAADYRRRAQEARERAKVAWDSATHDQLLELAAHLEALAAIEESKALQVAPITSKAARDEPVLRHIRGVLGQLKLRK